MVDDDSGALQQFHTEGNASDGCEIAESPGDSTDSGSTAVHHGSTQ